MFVLLCILIFVSNFGTGIYAAVGEEPLPTFVFLGNAGFLCGVVWWLRAEASRHSVKPVYCAGLLIGSGWMIFVPYLLFKTRGAKALIPLFVLGVVFVSGYLAGLLVYMTLLS
jgi:hypothetical protein